tara:strand:+ start:619 stop:840 length:222 start_codon:yes stop_codon:yes gene_type:complete
MTFFHFLATCLFLYVADERNHSQLHFGKKCFTNEYGTIYSHVWVTRPNQELPANKEQCEKSPQIPASNIPKPK